MTSDCHEEDYRRVVAEVGPTELLPGTSIEIVRRPSFSHPPRHGLFDFDGTLSLIREGWTAVMIPMMVETLRATGTAETDEELRAVCEEFVTHLTGKQTIYQMIRLADEVRRRGGTPEEPLVYKRRYLDLLHARIDTRHARLRSGRGDASEMLVPGSLDLLDGLKARGVSLYLASGTDEPFVLEEARLLGLEPYFGDHVYGAVDDYRAFSKARVVERILRENRVEGASLVGFGDGYVEIENVKAVGGIAVAVASDEAERSGQPDPWKRDRLIGAGADIVIPDYQDHRCLLEYLWGASGQHETGQERD